MTDAQRKTKGRQYKKQMFVDRFGGKCQICGYDKCIAALDFHHVDENTKEYSPQKVIEQYNFSDRTSQLRAENELEKCILVCSNCHRELHFNKVDILKTDIKVFDWLVIECKTCKTEFKTKIKKQIYCSPTCSQIAKKKTSHPTKDELQKLIAELSWTKIGKMYNVSDNAVRKWARKYELIK